MLLYGLLQSVDHLARGEVLHVGHQLQQSVVAKLFLLSVLGLVQTVSIDEQLSSPDIVDGLPIEGVILPKTERMVFVLHLQELAVEHRRVVAAVAEVEPAGVEMEQSDKHRDEHHTLVVLRQALVHTKGDVGWREALSSKRTEQAGTLRHKQRGGHALAADIPRQKCSILPCST